MTDRDCDRLAVRMGEEWGLWQRGDRTRKLLEKKGRQRTSPNVAWEDQDCGGGGGGGGVLFATGGCRGANGKMDARGDVRMDARVDVRGDGHAVLGSSTLELEKLRRAGRVDGHDVLYQQQNGQQGGQQVRRRMARRDGLVVPAVPGAEDGDGNGDDEAMLLDGGDGGGEGGGVGCGWGVGRVSLAEAARRGRRECYLRYLNGAACVVYGIPVFLDD